MSIKIERLLMCDGGKDCPLDCPYASADSREWTAKRQRENAASTGWVHKADKDYCPDCAERLKLKVTAPKEPNHD